MVEASIDDAPGQRIIVGVWLRCLQKCTKGLLLVLLW